MASPFQNRIVGAVVLVALGVIILPGILDGDKKHYQSEFAAIPIIPTVTSNEPTNSLPPASQRLTDPVVPDNTQPENTLTDISTTSGISTTQDSSTTQVVNSTQTTTNVMNNTTSSGSSSATTTGNTVSSGTTASGTTVSGTTPPKATPNNPPPLVKEQTSTSTNTTVQPDKNPKAESPKGKAYVIQLAALTNVEKIQQVKATLSFANYSVFTIPATAVQGKTTRIFVGPDASRQKLEATLPALEKLTGLKGVVKEHKVTK